MIKALLGTTLFMATSVTTFFSENVKEKNTHNLTETKMEILGELVQKEWLKLPPEEAKFIRIYDREGNEIIANEQNKLSQKEKLTLRKSDFLFQSANEKVFYLDK